MSHHQYDHLVTIRTVGIVLCGMVLIAMGWYFLHSSRTTIAHVVLTDDGFLPAVLTIRPGTGVLFKTARDEPFWPATDSHPSHDVYPSFDSKKPVLPHEQWGFVVDQEGTWTYHDHLYPQYTGTIVVVDTTGMKPQKCNPRDESYTEVYRCWNGRFASVHSPAQLESVFGDMYVSMEASEPLRQQCHAITHLAGEAAFRVFKESGELVIPDQSFLCSYGYFHGFVLASHQSSGSLQSSVNICRQIQNNKPSESPFLAIACYHGIGHATFDEYSLAYWGDERGMLTHALQLCEEIIPDTQPRGRQSCAVGVYNGFVETYGEQFGRVMDSSDPFSVCRWQTNETYRQVCYEEVANRFLTIFDPSIEDVIILVNSIEEPEDKEAAAFSVYSAIPVRQYSDGTESELATFCVNQPQLLKHSCIRGVSQGLFGRAMPYDQHEPAFRFCRSFSVSDDRHDCFSFVLGIVATTYPNEQKNVVCEAIEPEYEHYCYP